MVVHDGPPTSRPSHQVPTRSTTPRLRPASSFGLRMLAWGFFLMTVGLVMTLQTWLAGPGGAPYVLAVAPAVVGLVIVVRAMRLLLGFSSDRTD